MTAELGDVGTDIAGFLGLDSVLEKSRRVTAVDDQYYRDLLYLFELSVPENIGKTKESYLFPMVLNPTEYSLSEPFSVTATTTAEGGLYVEEDGIVQRVIQIRGNTGFKPRPYTGGDLSKLDTPKTGKSHGRTQTAASMSKSQGGVSGHRHFQFLQDMIFRTYADLKRDPSTARGTVLNFHVLKDDEHWRVVPQRFTLKRSASKRVTYNYEIDLLVVGPAEPPRKDNKGKEDKDILDSIKDALRSVESAVNTVNGIIQDITGFVDEIRRTVADVGKLLSNITGIIGNAADFVNGTAALIASPFAAVTTTITSLDAALEKMDAAGTAFPSTITNSFRRMQDAFDQLGAHPEVFESPSATLIRNLSNSSDISSSRTQAALEAIAEEAPPNSFAAQIAKGTGNTPGDLLKARGELGLGRELTQYLSADEYEITQGDSLQSLAAQHLGDARKWRHLAILNGLAAPYIAESGLPHTKKIGDNILIPSLSPPPQRRESLAVAGVLPSAEVRKRVLGTDFELRLASGAGKLFDFVVDTEGGSVDLKKVHGVDCLRQGLIQRLSTERGRDPLYIDLGLSRVIAVKIPALDNELIRFRIAQAIGADPRVAAVRNLQIQESSSADTVEIDVDAEVIGLSDTTSLVLGV